MTVAVVQSKLRAAADEPLGHHPHDRSRFPTYAPLSLSLVLSVTHDTALNEPGGAVRSRGEGRRHGTPTHSVALVHSGGGSHLQSVVVATRRMMVVGGR